MLQPKKGIKDANLQTLFAKDILHIFEWTTLSSAGAYSMMKWAKFPITIYWSIQNILFPV